MDAITLQPRFRAALALFLGCVLALSLPAAGLRPGTYWQVDDLRPGMQGTGRTVMHGTKIETFDAEVLGVLKNTSPGRDLVLCRLSGLNLDKTGVIAGMSGSPVTIDGKLVGAVSYAWAFGKEPIAGVTPFCQMHDYVEAYERRDLVEQARKVRRIGLHRPFQINGQHFDKVTVAQDFREPTSASDAGLVMVPLRTPVSASGFTAHSLALLRDGLCDEGLVPVQGGAAGPIAAVDRDVPLEAGGPLAVSLVGGDFDISGIGTVTHIEGNRVYGWGHPFMSLGSCEFPLQTGYIHTVYPRQTVSFKMGSPLRTVGVINADVSTGIAGWLGHTPDLLPVTMTVTREYDGSAARTFRVQTVRQPSLLATLILSVLTNSVDMEGDLPEELTAELHARIEVEGREALQIHDTFSGSSYAGGRAPQALYRQIASIIDLLTYNGYKPVRINKVECETRISSGRRTAEIEAIELGSDSYRPGETLKAVVTLTPFKGTVQRLPVSLALPADLPEGPYTVTICDDLAAARAEVRDNPTLSNPQNVNQVFDILRVQTAVKRTNLVLRLPVNAAGVAINGTALPDLPPSMVHMLGNTRRTGAQPINSALVARHPTEWVIQGSDSARFVVTKHKKVLPD